ncbi:RNA lariat debranching enzyme [Penicillium pulvis]|uniref:RNA lariat debranching enzyme n=1 Tax=Penicillium pulvis TaxID=1562058 RepID=UPI0025480ECD|nr:RNA lariat debranching enzyme [Penicillium pulvis]KAJ5785324.1 RNA lariat debranching enzyme [Penicillium pulvis]
MSSPLRIATVGCGHGALNEIYHNLSVEMGKRSWDSVDCVIIGGDFQSLRNSNDATCISVPPKYKSMGDFHEYYSGERVAPVLTIFCGGNHEAGNYLFELYYGGWVAPNIYYLGAANVLRLGPLRISGMSGIWKGYDYAKSHYERLPYNDEDVQSIYHTREIDVRKLLQVRTQVDIGLSHDWPRSIEKSGDSEALFRKKKHLREDSIHGRLGSKAARDVLDRLRPAYWFSAHLHARFALTMGHDGTAIQKAEPSCDEPLEWRYASVAAPVTPVKAKSSPGERTSPEKVFDNAAGSEQSRLEAWQTFGANVSPKERAENERIRAEFNDPSRAPTTPSNFQVTWREVKGDNREKTIHKPAEPQVQNDDEIALDSSSSESGSPSSSPPAKRAAPAPAAMDGICESKAIMDDSIPENVRSKLPTSLQAAPVDSISEAIRSKLPASLTQPVRRPEPPKMSHPEAIKNRVTKFLALDKPGGHGPYLELLEVKPISDQPNTGFQRPFRLQYDQEWLAITRAFAQDLRIGEFKAETPANRGEAEYLQSIMEAEAWVEKNVVAQDKLDVPYNFVRVAPVFDPSVPVTTLDTPPEYPNPQTAEFCELVGIENKFALSDEELAARMARGPRPNSRSNFDPSQRRGARGRRQGRGGPRRGGQRFG